MICLQDWGVQFYPWYQFATHEIKINHTLPLWDPFSYSGRNFIGEIQTAVFYPWNWFVFVGPLRKMLSVDWVHLWILLSFVLGAWGMYRCARLVGLERAGSVLSGVAFVFGGYMSRRAVQQINVFQGSLWLPVVFLFFLQMFRQTDRRQQFKYMLLAGAAWGMSFLAGHHEPGLYIGLGLGFFTLLYLLKPCFAIGRQGAVLLLLLTAGCAFLAAAVQLLPARYYSKSAYRWAGEAFAPNRPIPLAQLEAEQRVDPPSLFSLLFPIVDAKGESDIYFGILPLLLAIYGLSRGKKTEIWRFGALAAFALLYSFSGFSSVHGPLVAGIPILRMARESTR